MKEDTMTYPTAGTESFVQVPVSADLAISSEIDRIAKVEATGTTKVDGVDWCLRRLLWKAHEQLMSGPAELDLEAERTSLLMSLSDETDVDWNAHFDEAVRRLEVIFAPRPS